MPIKAPIIDAPESAAGPASFAGGWVAHQRLTYDPYGGHQIRVVRDRLDDRVLGAFVDRPVSLAWVAAGRLTLGFCWAIGGEIWEGSIYSWHRDPSHWPTLSGVKDQRLLPESARTWKLSLVDADGAVLATRVVRSSLAFAWRFNHEILRQEDANDRQDWYERTGAQLRNYYPDPADLAVAVGGGLNNPSTNQFSVCENVD